MEMMQTIIVFLSFFIDTSENCCSASHHALVVFSNFYKDRIESDPLLDAKLPPTIATIAQELTTSLTGANIAFAALFPQ